MTEAVALSMTSFGVGGAGSAGGAGGVLEVGCEGRAKAGFEGARKLKAGCELSSFFCGVGVGVQEEKDVKPLNDATGVLGGTDEGNVANAF